MEFKEKLQELRKQRGLTQEELAEMLFVSRTAVSKWESGRGFPNIESLKMIAKFFSVSLDDLLSNEQILFIAENDTKQKENQITNLIFGLLDCSMLLFLFLPLFAYNTGEFVKSASLFDLTNIGMFVKTAYFVLVFFVTLVGITTLALQSFIKEKHNNIIRKTSFMLSIIVLALFILTKQPYAAFFSLFLLVVKTSILINRKWHESYHQCDCKILSKQTILLYDIFEHKLDIKKRMVFFYAKM